MPEEHGPFYRRGEPGGPGCPISVLPIQIGGSKGESIKAELLDAGEHSTEIGLLRTIASRLGVQWGHDDFGWWAVVRETEFPTWAVWRQDDAGNEYLVEANLTESRAREMVSDFDARGHKQGYWCGDTRLG
jgi:hypothetical protein